MEKQLKSCTGVLLRADLTGHGQFSQSADFCQKGWDGHVLLGQPTKGHPCRISILFSQCSTTLLAPHITKMVTYFAPLYFWTFVQCRPISLVSSYSNFCIFQVVSCILPTIELIFLNVKAQYYPVKDIVGSSFCYFHDYTILWFGMYTQFSSLFIAFYRYICIFFGKNLVQLNISPKVIDK